MDQKEIALELLVRSGYPKKVDEFAQSEGFNEEKIVEKCTESQIYYAIDLMREEECGIDPRPFRDFFNEAHIQYYLSNKDNPELLNKIIDALDLGTNVMMEAYVQISPIDVLGVESLEKSIKKNINAPGMKERVEKLVNTGYQLVFCPHDIDSETLDRYFPILLKWKDFVNTQEIVESSLRDLAEDIARRGMEIYNTFDNYRGKFIYNALSKMVELSDMESVSKILFERLEGSEVYQKMLDDGVIEEYFVKSEKATSNKKLEKALINFEQSFFPDSYDIKNHLIDVVKSDDKEYLSQVLGKWFGEGRRSHFLALAKYEDGSLYDHEVARDYVSNGIADASRDENFDRLRWALEMPEYLVDEKNENISGFVTAYQLYKKDDEN